MEGERPGLYVEEVTGSTAVAPPGTRFRAALVAPVAALAMLSGLVLSAGPSADAVASDPATRTALGDRVKLGAFVDGMAENPLVLTTFEQAVGRTTDIASYYYGYDGHDGGGVFPGEVELGFAAGGTRDVMVGWDLGPTRFTEWTAGQHDEYLARIAAAARDYPYDLYVRPWAEMNADWAVYQPTTEGERPFGGTYGEFRRAWRYVVTYMRDHGASNLRWVFNIAAETYAAMTPVGKIWPGRRFVDVLGMDGFNWGEDDSWGTWRSFGTIFAQQYRRLVALHPTAPVWICELGAKEPLSDDGAPIDLEHSKARWIRNTFALTGFPRIEAIVWFDALKERDWRLESSPGALLAARRAFGDL